MLRQLLQHYSSNWRLRSLQLCRLKAAELRRPAADLTHHRRTDRRTDRRATTAMCQALQHSHSQLASSTFPRTLHPSRRLTL